MTAPSAGNDPPKTFSSKWHPFLDSMRIPAAEMGQGTAKLEFEVLDVHLRFGGIVHGGVFATVLDTVTGYAAYSVVPKGCEVVTMQLSMNMTATAKLGDRIIATSKVLHTGRRTAVISGELRHVDGKLLVTGTATMFFIEGAIVS